MNEQHIKNLLEVIEQLNTANYRFQAVEDAQQALEEDYCQQDPYDLLKLKRLMPMYDWYKHTDGSYCIDEENLEVIPTMFGYDYCGQNYDSIEELAQAITKDLQRTTAGYC